MPWHHQHFPLPQPSWEQLRSTAPCFTHLWTKGFHRPLWFLLGASQPALNFML